MSATKICKKCGCSYPATPAYFHKSSSCRYGLNPRCRWCVNAMARERWRDSFSTVRMNALNHRRRKRDLPPYRSSDEVMCVRLTAAKATAVPSMREIAWASGFIEGEGSIGGKAGRHCILAADQKNRQPLERLQAVFGGSIYKRNGRELHVWQVSGPRARGVMMTLYSLLSARRRMQVEKALLPSK